MARVSAEILDDDEEIDTESFMLDAVGLDYIDFLDDERILTRENVEKNFHILGKMVDSRTFRSAPYFVIGYFILITGAKMSEKLRNEILYAAKWEHEEGLWFSKDFEALRKICLKDFREKIKNHKPNQLSHPIKLKNYSNLDQTKCLYSPDDFKSVLKSTRADKIRHIKLDGWSLNTIPDEIFNMNKLESLSMEFNNISDIPENITELHLLKYLNLQYNKITTLPDSISNIPSLEYLDLSYNSFNSIPKTIENMKSVQILGFDNNNISDLSSLDIKKLVNLKSLYLRKNKIKKILEKLKPEEGKKTDPRSGSTSLTRSLFSKALRSSKIFEVKKDDQKVTSLELILDKSKVYDLFGSFLAVSSKNEITFKKPYKFKDSYLITNDTKEKLQPFLEKKNLLQRNIVRTKQLKQILGIKLDFIEIAETLFRNFAKEHPSPKSSKRAIHFKKPQFNTKRIVIGAVSTIAILLIVFGLVQPFLSSSQTVVIQKYDLVKIDYQIWESDASKNYNVFNPSFDDTIWITMIPITENSTSGLILGLYDNLLGKQKYYESDLIWLDKCIDQDRNGIDDLSGRSALSFGNSTDLHFNTYLMIKFNVLDVQKM